MARQYKTPTQSKRQFPLCEEIYTSVCCPLLTLGLTKKREMIFDIATTISFLSQGTTLERGTIIMTGTGPGIGAMRNPKISLKAEDDMRVKIEQIGTLINKVYYE